MICYVHTGAKNFLNIWILIPEYSMSMSDDSSNEIQRIDLNCQNISPLLQSNRNMVFSNSNVGRSILDEDQDNWNREGEDKIPTTEIKGGSNTVIKSEKRYIYEELDRPWNYRIMLQLKQIGERSQGYKWMHNEESDYMTNYLQRLTLFEIIFTTLHGASLASSLVALFSDMGVLVLVIFTCLQTAFYVISTVLKTYKEASDFSSRIMSHHNTCIRFSSLAVQIQNQFCLPVSKRVDDESFLEYKSNEFNDILLGAPSIRETTKTAYLESVKNIDIAKPLSLGNIGQIEIVIDKGNEDRGSELESSTNPPPKVLKEVDRQLQFDINRFLGIINHI